MLIATIYDEATEWAVFLGISFVIFVPVNWAVVRMRRGVHPVTLGMLLWFARLGLCVGTPFVFVVLLGRWLVSVLHPHVFEEPPELWSVLAETVWTGAYFWIFAIIVKREMRKAG